MRYYQCPKLFSSTNQKPSSAQDSQTNPTSDKKVTLLEFSSQHLNNKQQIINYDTSYTKSLRELWITNKHTYSTFPFFGDEVVNDWEREGKMKGDGEGGRLVIIGFGMDTNYKPDIEF